MTKEERELAIPYLEDIKESYVEGNGYERHPLPEYYAIETAIKFLSQESRDDVMAIHTQGLDEGVRCAMCTNSMKSDTGCDGGCMVDDELFKRIMDTINNHIIEHPSSEDCVDDDVISRKQALKGICNLYPRVPQPDLKTWQKENSKYFKCENVIRALPPITPERKKGKWIDSVYSLGYTCTCCLTTQTSGWKYKYCPNCGAEMEDADEN